jgi:5-methylcytosine-specific restriction endonuclease McrA
VCKVNLLVAEFSKCSKAADGLNTRCRKCAKDYYQRNREQILAQKSAYYKDKYDHLAQYRKDYYTTNRQRLLAQKRELYVLNVEALRAKNRAYARNNRDKMNAYYRKYAVENPDIIRKKRIKRRLRMMDNGVFEVSKRDLSRLLSRPCVFCGSQTNITLDHVIPVARGGRHSVGNLMPLCLSCNTSKQDKTFMEFRMSKIMQAEMKL